MKLVVTIILALAVAVGLALAAMDDPGYVTLARDPYVVRLPLLLFVLLLALGFVALYLLFNFIAGLFRVPKRYRQWRTQSNENNAHKHTMAGYAGLIEGNWAKAEQALLKKLEYNKTPLMNYLGAAYAAQQQGHTAQRNQYLDDALKKHPRHQLAINLARARLLYKAGEITESRNYLENLRKSVPKNVAVARLLADAYQALGDWSSLVDLVPALKKLNAYPEQEMSHRERLAYDNLMASPALLHDELHDEPGRPATAWKSLPAAKRKNPQMIASYVTQLIKAGKFKQAEKDLRSALNRKFDAELMYLYGRVESPFLEYQIQLVESISKKQKQYSAHPDLLLTLARLYRYNGEYEKAKQYFKQSIAAGGRHEAFMDLGSLLEQTGDKDGALFHIKKGVEAMATDVGNHLKNHPQNHAAAHQGEIVFLEDRGADGREVMPIVR
ncbi:heme biosynthesis protein HemY [Candidatus Spongiihabitans sp.]|uniref:heme biosynthesis protein HemY n=1 Tax=Candidatus Spongiihabitans sp. TaxID=3101308 RepID=UPI003C7B5AE0